MCEWNGMECKQRENTVTTCIDQNDMMIFPMLVSLRWKSLKDNFCIARNIDYESTDFPCVVKKTTPSLVN